MMTLHAKREFAMNLIEILKESPYKSSLPKCIMNKSLFDNTVIQILMCEYIYHFSKRMLLKEKILSHREDKDRQDLREMFLVIKDFSEDKINALSGDDINEFKALKNKHILNISDIHEFNGGFSVLRCSSPVPNFIGMKMAMHWDFTRGADFRPRFLKNLALFLCYNIDVAIEENIRKNFMGVLSIIDSIYNEGNDTLGPNVWIKHRMLYWHSFSQMTSRYMLAYSKDRNPLPPPQ